MASISPVGFKEVLKLTENGIAQDIIKFANVSVQSSKYVCVLEGKSVAIIETATKKTMRLNVAVKSAIMNPVSKVVAIRAQDEQLQIYNLEMKTLMKNATLPEPVVYWKWMDPKTIAIVTSKAVYHWSMDGNQQPAKIFVREAHDSPVQILNYVSSGDGKWLLLAGVAVGGARGVSGVLQLYSVEKKASNHKMDAHAGTFATLQINGRAAPSTVFCFVTIGDNGSHIHAIELGLPKDQAFSWTTPFDLSAPDDFPLSMHSDDDHGQLFLVSKKGFLYMHEILSGQKIFGEKASPTVMFTSAKADTPENGIVSCDQSGRVCHFYVDEKNIVPFITQKLNNTALGVKLAAKYNLPGADDVFQQQFNTLMQQGQYQKAMQLAANSPQGILRTANTINALRNLPPNAGVGLLQYFQMLLQQGTLNALESIELATPVLAKGTPQGLEHIKTWLKEKKLEPSEDLGDLLKTHDMSLALSVYLHSNAPEKVVGCFLFLGAQAGTDEEAAKQFGNILAYSKQVNYTPNYPVLLGQLLRANGQRATQFALSLINRPEGALTDINQCVDLFLSNGDPMTAVKNTTNVLLEYLKPRGDQKEDGDLQTKLLEINLMHKPDVADAIMESDEYNFTQYNRLKIAQLCERAQLFQRALEHYTDLADIKRVLSNTHMLNPDFLLEYFGKMSPDNCLDCLRDLLKFNLQNNIRLVVEVAKKWSDYLTPEALVALFEEFKSFNGIYFYLGSFVNFTTDPDVVFKYIEAATKLGQLKEIERVCRDNNHYDAKQVKEFLIQANLKDPRPLIHVCDRNGFVDELTQFLQNNNLFVFIEAYVQRMNSKAAPQVVGTLLDMNCGEEEIKKLLSSVRPPADMPEFTGDLCEQIEKRSRLRLLRPWLEERRSEGSEDPHVHNGLAKIYIDINNNPAQFLSTNKFYDSKIVGEYCESRDPHLSFVCYKRAWGKCDDELLNVTNKNGFFKDQARYLVERQDLELWEKVLEEKNEFRRQVIDQVVSTALPESRVPDEVSVAVKAFMAANLPNELIELLERIILHGGDSEFAQNRNLQNLLILTAIKADPERVMDYIKRLDNYDGPDIAQIALSEQYELFEEALFIYKKHKKGEEAIRVLIENIKDLDRASEFAEYWDQPETWSILANAQLEATAVTDSIASFLRADDAKNFVAVINAAHQGGHFEELIGYIKMARSKIKDPILDNELIYSYARTERLPDLEEFIGGSHVAKISEIGDMCFDEKLYTAAKILFNHINNNAKLAICLVKLEAFQEAVDAARKANAIATWKAVCFSCVDAGKFRLAQMCAIHIIVFMDHLLDLVQHYEVNGHFDQVISVLEQGINLDRAGKGIYTQLGIMYARHNEEKLMEHIKLFWSRLNIAQLLDVCQKNLHWPHVVFLYTHDERYENALNTMMTRSAECWNHNQFKEIIGNVTTTEIYYRAIDFYLSEHPLLLNDLLLDLATNLDHTRVVNKVRHSGTGNLGHLPLILKYMKHVQHENSIAVNEAINDIYFDDEDYRSLRESIDNYAEFDQIALAQRCESHELVEFRRIAALLFKMNKRYGRSIDLSKQDSMWRDATETAAESRDCKLAEELLSFFVESGRKECFAACLFTCYELIRSDVVLELAWRNKLMNFAMPFFIQALRDYDTKLATIQRALTQGKEEKAAEKAEAEEQQAAMGFQAPSPMLALPAPPGMGGMGMGGMNGMGGMGMNNGMGGMGMGGMNNGMGGMGGMGMGGMNNQYFPQ